MILYRESGSSGISRPDSITLSNGKGIIGGGRRRRKRKKVLILLFIWPVVDKMNRPLAMGDKAFGRFLRWYR